MHIMIRWQLPSESVTKESSEKNRNAKGSKSRSEDKAQDNVTDNTQGNTVDHRTKDRDKVEASKERRNRTLKMVTTGQNRVQDKAHEGDDST